MCLNAFVEDVFVPLPMCDGEQVGCIEAVAEATPGDARNEAAMETEAHLEPPMVIMEFWPEDEPGKIVIVYLDEIPEVKVERITEARPTLFHRVFGSLFRRK